MWCWIALAVLIMFITVLYLCSPLISPPKINLHNAHVLITGGSSGIGKCIAVEALKQGAKVTIVARDKKKLDEARKELATLVCDKYDSTNSQKIQVVSVDLSKDSQSVETAFQQAESILGPVDFLVNCAGCSIPGKFDDLAITDFMKMMDINYMSAVYATRALLPGMKARSRGRVAFISSQAGQLGMFGFSAYSASKFALRGLAESLQMEVKAHNIHITLAFPPDTNTPGFENENKTKPEETKLISETSGIFSPEHVAQIILTDVVSGKFLSSVGLDGLILSSLTCGFSPVTSIMEATQQVVTMGLFRIICLFYLDHFDRLIRKCKEKNESCANKKNH